MEQRGRRETSPLSMHIIRKTTNNKFGGFMRFLCIRAKGDNTSFRLLQGMGVRVCELDDLDKIDEMISILINEKYNTIFLSSQVAGFSEDIIKKYKSLQDVNIIIAPNRRI